MPDAGKRAGKNGAQDDVADVAPVDFDALLEFDDAGGAQFFNGFNANQDGPGAGEADTELAERQHVGIFPAGTQVIFCLVEILAEERQEVPFVCWGEQSGGRELELLQFFRGEVAAAIFQVSRQIAQDVDELEAFAKADAIHDKLVFVEPGIREQMGAASPGPKFTHAAGDAIGVVVQFNGGLEGNDALDSGSGLGERGEPLEVQFLTAGDGAEDVADAFLVFRGKLTQCIQAVVDFFEEEFFGGGALLSGEVVEIQRSAIFAQDAFAELLQGNETLVQRDDLGIGNGIGGAGEEVGERDLGADGTGQHAQRQVKGTGRSAEQIFLRCSKRGHGLNGLRRVAGRREDKKAESRKQKWKAENRGGTGTDAEFLTFI